jgi:hypothetical protein
MTTVNNLNLTEPTPQATPAASKRTISRLALLASRVPASLWRYLLIGSDAVLILLAFVGAYALRYQAQLFHFCRSRLSTAAGPAISRWRCR